MRSSFNDPLFQGPNITGSNRPITGYITENSQRGSELARGNTILMSYGLFIDYQYRYIHHLQKIWFDDYSNSTGVSISEAAQARDKIEWSGDGLSDDPS